MHEPLHFPLTIYFDGACRVCAAEIAAYLRADRRQRLLGVDISAPGFDPAALGLPRAALLAELHVIDASGRVFRNIAAFVAIWQAFPESRYRILARLFSLPFVAPLARAGYRLFARYRHLLPRRTVCDGENCRPRC